jgi:hypothetical protein
MVSLSVLLLIVALTLSLVEIVAVSGKNLLAWAVFFLCVVHLWRP